MPQRKCNKTKVKVKKACKRIQGNRMSYVKVRVAKGQEVWSNKRFQSLKKE
jgi:hypothetical protein